MASVNDLSYFTSRSQADLPRPPTLQDTDKIREAQDHSLPDLPTIPPAQPLGPNTHPRPCSPGKRPLFNLAGGSEGLAAFPKPPETRDGGHPGEVMELNGRKAGRGTEKGNWEAEEGKGRSCPGRGLVGGGPKPRRV